MLYVLEKAPTVEPGALEVPDRQTMRGIDRSLGGLFLDTEMWKLAHADGRLSLRLGEALAPMLQKKGYSALGYSNPGDYCREELGMSLSTAERMVRLFRRMEKLPLVREAFLEGALSECQALLLQSYLPRLGHEAEWVARARELTVRGLEEALKLAVDKPVEDGPEVVATPPARELRRYRLTPGELLDWQLAREVAGRVAGSDLKDWELLEFLAAEFLAGPHPVAGEGPVPSEPPRAGTDAEERRRRLAELWKVLEEEFARWDFLEWEPVAVELGTEMRAPLPEDPHQRQAAIDQLALCRRRLQLDLGRMLFTFDRMSLWRDAGFAGLKHYALERLGLSSSSVHRMIARERGFLNHPLVYDAVREGRLTLSQADRLFPVLAEVHDSFDGAWVEFAETTTCRHLEAVAKACCDLAGTDRESFRLSGYAPPRERPAAIRLKARRDWRAVLVPGLGGPLSVAIGRAMAWLPTLTDRRGQERTVSLQVKVPCEVMPVLEAAEAAARAHGASDCSAALRMFLAGFMATWRKADRQMRARTRRIMEACDYRCQVPGCTRRAFLHQHHLEFRSHGGGNEDANLAGVCDVHHQGHLHGGTMKARREEQGSILWEVGIRGGQAYRVFRDETRIGGRGALRPGDAQADDAWDSETLSLATVAS